MKLAVLTCEGCGAALPIVDTSYVTCGACGAEREVPEVYAAHRQYSVAARARRREAERVYRALCAKAVSAKTVERFAKFGIPGLVLGIPGLLWLTQALAAWQLRTWVVFGVFFPLLAGCLALAVLMVRVDPLTYVSAIGGRLRPGAPSPTGGATCGVCGAPLVPEKDALCATCDYCLADSWLEAIPDAHVEGTARERTNLEDLVRGADLQTYETWLFAVLCALIPGGFLLWLWIGFS